MLKSFWQELSFLILILIKGCKYGTCNKPGQCICEEGWTGTLCDIPVCREGCHELNGHCRWVCNLHWGKIPSVWSKTLSIGSKFPVFEVKFPVSAVKFLGSVVKFLGSVVKFLGSVAKCLGFRVKFLWLGVKFLGLGVKFPVFGVPND